MRHLTLSAPTDHCSPRPNHPPGRLLSLPLIAGWLTCLKRLTGRRGGGRRLGPARTSFSKPPQPAPVASRTCGRPGSLEGSESAAYLHPSLHPLLFPSSVVLKRQLSRSPASLSSLPFVLSHHMLVYASTISDVVRLPQSSNINAVLSSLESIFQRRIAPSNTQSGREGPCKLQVEKCLTCSGPRLAREVAW